MKNATSTLEANIVADLKVSDFTAVELADRNGVHKSSIYTAISRLRNKYNISTIGKSIYHLEEGPALTKEARSKSVRQIKIDALIEVLEAYPGDYVPKAIIKEYTCFTTKELYKVVFAARETYDILHGTVAGYLLVGKKKYKVEAANKPKCIRSVELHTAVAEAAAFRKATGAETDKALAHSMDASKFAEPLSVTSKNKKPVRSPVDKIMYLAMVIDEVTVDDVIDKIHVKEADVNRLMHEAANKYNDKLVYVCELTPAKDVRRIGGFVSKEGLTKLEVRAWHFVMSSKKCRADDFAIHFGMSSNDAARLMKCVAKKFEATVTYESYIKAI